MPPLIEVGVTLLLNTPSLSLVTSTVNMQLLLIGIVTAGGKAVKEIMVEPATAVGAVPKHVP